MPAIEKTRAEVATAIAAVRHHGIQMLLPRDEIIADEYGEDGGERDPPEIDRHRQMMKTHYPPQRAQRVSLRTRPLVVALSAYDLL